jgi:formate hydrogenlyase transcriptional activator
MTNADLIGSSARFRTVLQEMNMVAPVDSTVLIEGETGTGKEVIAQAIHEGSPRRHNRFVALNCSAIPSTLLESELFGHERGAFTGATVRTTGRFQSADRGTLFLDEIGDLPLELQPKLLRVLQEKQFERLGGGQTFSVDVRIIAATNQNLLLLEYFVERHARKAGKTIKRIENRTLELFKAYDWPGNIRELQNIVERAVVLSETDTLFVAEEWLSSTSLACLPSRDGASALAERETEMIEAALAETHGRISGPSGAAVKLRIPRQTLESKIRRLGTNKYGLRVHLPMSASTLQREAVGA